MSERRCCAKRNKEPAHTQQANTLCDACMSRAQHAIANLPTQHAQLHTLIGEQRAGINLAIRHVKPSSVVPLNMHVDTLRANIEHTTICAAEIIADNINSNNPTDVYTACVLIVHNLSKLSAISSIDVMRWLPAGTYYYVSTSSGHELIQQLEHLAASAAHTLGQTRERTKRDLPCARCGQHKVGRWAGSDHFDCTACGARFIEDDIRRQDRILVELAKRGAYE